MEGFLDTRLAAIRKEKQKEADEEVVTDAEESALTELEELGRLLLAAYIASGEQPPAALIDWAEEKLQAQEHARLLIKSQNLAQRKIDDDLTDALVAGADLAHAADERLRRVSERYRAATQAGAQCRDDAPPAARLSEQTRADLVHLARDCNDAVNALAAWQRRE